MSPKLTITHDVNISVEQLAQLFCGLDDEKMADFFEHVGKIAESWSDPVEAAVKGAGAENQWWAVGGHMRKCACITNIGRSVIDGIHYSMHYK